MLLYTAYLGQANLSDVTATFYDGFNTALGSPYSPVTSPAVTNAGNGYYQLLANRPAGAVYINWISPSMPAAQAREDFNDEGGDSALTPDKETDCTVYGTLAGGADPVAVLFVLNKRMSATIPTQTAAGTSFRFLLKPGQPFSLTLPRTDAIPPYGATYGVQAEALWTGRKVITLDSPSFDFGTLL